MTKKYQLDPKKLSGLTTDGAPAMVGKHKGFCKTFLEAFGAQKVVLNHCIIHQKNLCNKVQDGIDIMKEVVNCVNYIRSRGLNHRQFKVFFKELDCDYPEIMMMMMMMMMMIFYSRLVTIFKYMQCTLSKA